MASRMFWRPLVGGVAWTSVGVGAGLTLPSFLVSNSMVYSTPIITTSLWGGAVVVLLPLGVTRGIIASVQDILQVHGRPALQKAMDDWKIGLSRQFLTSHEGNQQLLERLTLGSGWQGRLVRTMASPFLPSTSQMMVRLQELVEKEAATASAAATTTRTTDLAAENLSTTLDSHVIVAAVDGFVEGFLQDQRDTITMLGLLGYAGIVGLGFGVDYTYRRAIDWNQQRTGSVTSENSSKQKDNNAEEKEQRKGLIDLKAMQRRLRLPQSRANQEIEHALEEEQKREQAAAAKEKETKLPPPPPPPPQDKPLSVRETIDAAQIQVGQLTKWLLKGKQHADPYFRQAWDVAGNVRDEVEGQAGQLFDQAKQIILNEENQQRFRQQWKNMVHTMQDMSPDDKTLGRMTRDMEEILKQAKKRMNEEDVQEMRKDMEQAIEQAKSRIDEEKKRAKVDERFTEATEGIHARLKEWWNGR